MKADEENEAGREDVADIIVDFDRVTSTVEAKIASTAAKMHARDDSSEAADEEDSIRADNAYTAYFI